MRLLFALVLIAYIAILFTEAKTKDRKEWKQKKMELSRHTDSYRSNKMEKHAFQHEPRTGKSHRSKNGRKKMSYSQRKKSKGNKHKFGHGDLSWVTVIEDADCTEKCNRGHVCIMGPIDSKHVCVHKKDLKKSVKLFFKYQKKEMKAWNKFKKQRYDHHNKMELFEDMEKDKFAALKKEHMDKHGHVKNMENFGSKKHMKHHGLMGGKKDDFEMEKHQKHHMMGAKMDDFDMEKMDKHMMEGQMVDLEMEKLMKQHMMPEGHMDGHQMKKHQKHHMMGGHIDNYEMDKHMKHFKPQTDLIVPLAPVEAGSDEECETAQFSQMRGRMMGWFHLLHGQDHLARQAHGGSLKHFYKHVSVKKELREHNGDKCECLKSAMWQFHQMDKNDDDHLSPDELVVMEQDSLEPCMKPYLVSCDRNADSKLSSDEWCCCFANVVAPCFKKLDELRIAGDTESYVPACDKEGYYMREQCGGKSNEMSCWCVDYNGNELKGTRTKGRAHCHKLALSAFKSSEKSVMP